MAFVGAIVKHFAVGSILECRAFAVGHGQITFQPSDRFTFKEKLGRKLYRDTGDTLQVIVLDTKKVRVECVHCFDHMNEILRRALPGAPVGINVDPISAKIYVLLSLGDQLVFRRARKIGHEEEFITTDLPCSSKKTYLFFRCQIFYLACPTWD